MLTYVLDRLIHITIRVRYSSDVSNNLASARLRQAKRKISVVIPPGKVTFWLPILTTRLTYIC